MNCTDRVHTSLIEVVEVNASKVAHNCDKYGVSIPSHALQF